MRSQGILHFFRSLIHWAHRAVIFATARLSCFFCKLHAEKVTFVYFSLNFAQLVALRISYMNDEINTNITSTPVERGRSLPMDPPLFCVLFTFKARSTSSRVQSVVNNTVNPP